MMSSALWRSSRQYLSKSALRQNHFRTLTQVTRSPSSRPRSTLSRIWVPTGGVSATEGESGHGKLLRAGFLRQSQSGIFQLLPLGLRVQDKIEQLIDKHMQNLGASKLALSTFTTEELWRKSGRLSTATSELFRLSDRRGVPIILCPTHEEDITALVASTLRSYRDLPLKLYQITRKYRDEIRPRQGLLRSREFIMKDLYTFDQTIESAARTYDLVSSTYKAFFSELKLPVLVAEASSGDIGGNYSHEYHLPNAIGEDTVATCNSCGYSANDEVAAAKSTTSLSSKRHEKLTAASFSIWRGVTKDRKTLVNVWYPSAGPTSSEDCLNIHAVKSVVAELDTSVRESSSLWGSILGKATAGKSDQLQLLNVIDSRLASTFEDFRDHLPIYPVELGAHDIQQVSISETKRGIPLNVVRIIGGDDCPRCGIGSLKIQRALELGHTFLLGTRYSEPLGALVTLPQQPGTPVPAQMGCFGIGVSRIIGAVAEHLADEKGLNWPRVIAPFEVVIIPTSSLNDEIFEFYDSLANHWSFSTTRPDVVLDDRKQSFGWKIQDADMTGYPVTIVLGKQWRENGICEVQCKRLSVKENIAKGEVPQYLATLLEQL